MMKKIFDCFFFFDNDQFIWLNISLQLTISVIYELLEFDMNLLTKMAIV